MGAGVSQGVAVTGSTHLTSKMVAREMSKDDTTAGGQKSDESEQ
jgi:hypothetical protein